MLRSLHIENMATIKKLDIDLDRGFTVLTGETGAGKSMIIDSLNLLVGNLKGRDIIRNGEEYAFVEACFSDLSDEDAARLAEYGAELDPDDGMLYVGRRIYADGRSRSSVNGRTFPAGVQRDVCRTLIDIHGQHDNQILLNPASHLGFVDKYASNTEQMKRYSAAYEKYCEIKRRIKSLSSDEKERARLVDMLNYQIKEISDAHLKAGEEEALESKKKKIRNMEKILRSSRTAYRALYKNEKGISAFDLIGMAASAVEQLSEHVDGIAGYGERLNECRYEIEDIAERIHDMCEVEEENPTALLDKIETRLEVISKLKRKYGATVVDVIAFAEGAEKELHGIESSGEQLEQAQRELTEHMPELEGAAEALSESRRRAAEELSRKVIAELRFLDMEKISFTVRLDVKKDENGKTVYSSDGCDDAEFLISTNVGEPEKPLARIASGGELSRIMLAVKSVLSKHEGYGTQIFDEIDTGVSGKTAQKIGLKLHGIAEYSQVICITHLAQIAALADTHLFVKKTESDGRAVTGLERLEGEDRVGEVARILGGINVTETQRKAALEMINYGK